MDKLVLRKEKEIITSLELLEKINQFREELEGKNELQHKDLLKVIRDEFEEEIGEGKISPTYYKDSWNREQPMFILTFNQAKQVLVRESKYVRKRIFEYIEFLEKQNLILKQALWNKQNSEWLQTREQGKLVRRNETDVIASLILYAKDQGSKNADKMYLTYSKLVNNLVGIRNGMRDIVDVETLLHIRKLEDLFSKLIIDGMENKMYYKEIYKECKKIGLNMIKYLTLDIKLLRG